MRKSELKLKDVIDIERGKNLGFIEDVDINVEDGNIQAIIVPQASNIVFRFFSNKDSIIINWNDIVKIGEDVILVRV